MTRIANLADNALRLDLLMRTQSRVSDLQTRLSTEKKSQDYAGIAPDTRRLLSAENTRTLMERFKENNEVMQTRLGVVDSAVASIDQTVREFRDVLRNNNKTTPLDQRQVGEMQAFAFRALQSMEAALNTDVDGRHLFAGGRTSTEPVDLGLTSLADFQTRFDGQATPYPADRDTNLQGYYRGDRLAQTHRVDDQRSFALDVDAADPPFERAIRAMGLIAQGAFGSAGGLDQNPARVDEAIELLNQALEPADPAVLAAAGELPGNLAEVRAGIGFDQVVLNEATIRQRDLIARLEIEAGEIENADPLETITRLLDESRALEASYQALAHVRRLSLTEFL
jgi:flagellin-like hook-associated protein FlgL